MRINIKATKINLTPAIEGYVMKKIGSLEKFLKKFKPSQAEAYVEVGRTTAHHNKGAIFRAEVNLRTLKKMLRAEYAAPDLYGAIDLTHDELKRQIISAKNKMIDRRVRAGSRRKQEGG